MMKRGAIKKLRMKPFYRLLYVPLHESQCLLYLIYLSGYNQMGGKKMIDKGNKMPLYLQLMRLLMEKVEKGLYIEHEQLPSERELCEIYEVSRITVRQALQELERVGIIYKLHGKGTFVAPKKYDQQLDALYSFTEEMKKLGKQPTTKILSFETLPVDDYIRLKMGLSIESEVYKVVRLRLADEEPLMYETTYLPSTLFPNLTKERFEEQSMYDLFQREYEKAVTNATEKFTATLLKEEEATYLEAVSGQAAMSIKRFAYHQNELIEYTMSIARGDKFAYTVELT